MGALNIYGDVGLRIGSYNEDILIEIFDLQPVGTAYLLKFWGIDKHNGYFANPGKGSGS